MTGVTVGVCGVDLVRCGLTGHLSRSICSIFPQVQFRPGRFVLSVFLGADLAFLCSLNCPRTQHVSWCVLLQVGVLCRGQGLPRYAGGRSLLGDRDKQRATTTCFQIGTLQIKVRAVETRSLPEPGRDPGASPLEHLVSPVLNSRNRT